MMADPESVVFEGVDAHQSDAIGGLEPTSGDGQGDAQRESEALLSGSATPTLDDNLPLLNADSVAPTTLDALTQHPQLLGIPLPNNQEDEEDAVDPRDTPVEDENPEPTDSRQRRLSEVSNFSLVSNNSFLELQNDKHDEISSLSGLSGPDLTKSPELEKSDLEDGEISAFNRRRKRRSSPERPQNGRSSRHSCRSSSSGGGRRRRSGGRRRPRSGSFDDNSRQLYDDRTRKRRTSSSNKRPADLPRYDVRNVIERKRKKSRRESRSRSRSWTRSHSRDRKRPKKIKKKRRTSRSQSPISPPPRKRLQSGRRSRSRTPPVRRRGGRRSLSRSPSFNRRGGRNRYSRSPSFDDRYSPLPPRDSRRLSSPKRGKSPKKKKGLAAKKTTKAGRKQRDRSPDILPERSSGKKGKKGGKRATGGGKKVSKSLVNGGVKSKKKRKPHDEITSSSVITEKEVFASGDKIMVSVNFRKTNDVFVPTVPPSAAELAANAKPTVVIDVMASPYQVIEPSPQEVIDVYSEDEEKKSKQTENNAGNGTKSPSPPIRVVPDDKPEGLDDDDQHKGPCTPPPPHVDQNFDLSRGPQTPTEEPLDSYDPCDPTESPEPDNSSFNGLLNDHQSNGNQRNGATTNGGPGVDSLLKSAASAIPFLLDDSGGGATNGDGGGGSIGGGSDNDNFPIDMDMDSPFSPGDSELSDIFEPPLNTPLTNKKMASKRPQQKGSRQKNNSKSSKNKHIHMKIVDDQLRIIDDVPTSAVEMAVKEKFLKKVQRQERAVEEIKMVLKPHYNRKRINKDDYKEILRKCVPKVCHSKKGDINPMKIQKLVKGYVKKYHYLRKRQA